MAKKYVEGKAAPLKEGQVRVQSGDSLWKLAEKYTGSGLNWRQLNGGKKLIKPGDVIDIPKNLWNPEIMVDGKPMRWRSEEYRKAYPNLVSGDNSRTLEEITVTPNNAATKKEKYETRRKGLVHQAGMDTWGTVLNAYDMPRRLAVAGIRDDYDVKDAVQFFGWQPYKSVLNEEYAREHPVIDAVANIGLGAAAAGTPSLIRNVAENAPKAVTNAMALGRSTAPRLTPHSADISYQAGKGAAGVTKTSWGKQGVNRVGTGTRSGATGKPSVQSRGVNSGKVKGSQVARMPAERPPLPVQTLPYNTQWSTYPGLWLPQEKPKAPVVPYRIPSRIETQTPWQVSLDELIRENEVAEGDTLVLPSGEQIKYVLPKEKINFNPRMIDVTSTNVYDAADVPENQYEIPGRREKTFGVQNQSVNKYYPQAPKGEQRGKKTYPYIVGGKSTYKPLK